VLIFAIGMTLTACVAAANREQGIGQPCTAVRECRAACNVIQGCSQDRIPPGVAGATISGGGSPAFPHQVTGDFGSIGGGLGNSAGELGTVAGGSHNTASAFRAMVGGGNENVASGPYSTIAGGESNTATYLYATVGGGNTNTATRRNATVGGGSGNTASFSFATVSGGANNEASGLESTVGGGNHNRASGTYATVSGGSGNEAEVLDATVSGGSGNIVTGEEGSIGGGLVNQVTDKYSTVGGGRGNVAGSPDDDALDAQYSTVGGGIENRASSLAASVCGGASNIASGAYSAIPGGSLNRAAGSYSVASGRRAQVRTGDDGTWLYADSNDAEFFSQASNEFAVRATGGVRFVTAIDASGEPAAGVRLPSGSGSWESLSDRNAKIPLGPVDGREVLTQVSRLPLAIFRYKTEAPSIRHIGPMAQDFHAAFAVGEDSRYISSLDADGVALAAIQGLNQVMGDMGDQVLVQQLQIQMLEDQVNSQRDEIEALSARLASLEKMVTEVPVSRSPFSDLPVQWQAIGALALGGIWLGRRAGPDQPSEMCP